MPLPKHYTETREALHRVAAHVVARRRFDVTGRFGLRATPGGFGTPTFGDPDREEVLRVAGPWLVRERRVDGAMQTTVHPLDGASLGALASFAGVDLDPGFSVGKDTPDVDAGAPLAVDASAVAELANWLHHGARALDRLLADLGPAATPSVVQLWPEHFDLACDVASGAYRANVGVSVGDRFSAAPYVYVGPIGPDRPGDAAYWNVPFGALLAADDLGAHGDPVDVMLAFFHHGCALLAG